MRAGSAAPRGPLAYKSAFHGGGWRTSRSAVFSISAQKFRQQEMTDYRRPYPRTSSLDFLHKCSPAISAFYRLWDGKRQGRTMPARQDIDVLELKPWLPGIILADVHWNPYRCLYRLVGSRVVAIKGKDPTGLPIDEGAHGGQLEETLEDYRIVTHERKLVYDWDDTAVLEQFMRYSEVLMLPLSNDDQVVNMIIAYLEVAPL
jgi:hypothetical protein